MQAVLSHRIALVPTAAQEVLLRQAVGVSRFAYNWALAEWKRQYQAGEKPSEAALRRQLNSIKRQRFRGCGWFRSPCPSKPSRIAGRRFSDSSKSRAAILSSRTRECAIRHASTTAPAHSSVTASRWFPSSKICSACGRISEELPLSIREARVVRSGLELARLAD